MAPKQDRVYARGRLKSVAPSARLVIGSDDERDLEYVPPGTSSPSLAAHAARATPNKEASGSAEVPVPTTAAESSSFYEADSSKSTPSTPTRALTLITDQPNRWCVNGQYQVYSDAKNLNDKGIMTRPLTLEQRADYPAKQDPLEQVLVRRIQVDMSLPSIRRYLYDENVDANRTPLTAEFDYRWQIVKGGQFLHETSLRETTKRWMALYLSINAEGDAAIAFPPQPDLHEEVFVAVMHKRAFKVTTAYPFPSMIFSLCRSAAQGRTATQAASTNTILVGSIPGSSTALSSYRSTPFPALVPLARVQKLEAQIAKLLHHIKPLMQNSIAEEEERLERRFVQHTERNIAERSRGRGEDDARAQKKERHEKEVARRASLSDEEARQIRAVELAVKASSSRYMEIAGGTDDSVVDVEDTTEGVQITEVVGSGEPDPPAW
ncbi:hypothetical protein EJD97_000138 [Solanum chilense]|uniref:Uncharacterized protein n=1 Tax=Solanum chilense TaxID=4083 RepID=A0A6N2AQX0_SOLCI|nr:hypothetical protein EJD97_000138 [Solanum chilense]